MEKLISLGPIINIPAHEKNDMHVHDDFDEFCQRFGPAKPGLRARQIMAHNLFQLMMSKLFFINLEGTPYVR